MSSFLPDIRFGIRMLLKRPGLTAVAIISLALGIGANTAIFSVMDATLLRSLPFAEPDRLLLIKTSGFFGEAMSGADLNDLQTQSKSFAPIGAYSSENINLSGDGEPERLSSSRITPNFCALLGRPPQLGRAFADAEAQSGGDRVALLSDGLWRRRFGADKSIVGRTIKLDAHDYTVVGVMPAGFSFPEQAQVWTPLRLGAAERADYDDCYLRLVGRLKPGATIGQARAELETIGKLAQARYPEFRRSWRLDLISLHENLVGENRTLLFILLGAVSLVLFIACANVANLLLALASGRQRELAVRLALGAGRTRLFRQLLTESALLAILAGGLGIVIAVWGMEALTRLLPAQIPRVGPITLNGSVLLFTALVSAGACLLFGLAPAYQAGGVTLNEALKQGGRAASSHGGARRLRAGLVIGEIAVAVMLLAGAGLLVKSLIALRHVPLGFRPEQVLSARLELPAAKYSTSQQTLNFQRELLDQVRALPGVQADGITSSLPFAGNLGLAFAIEGSETPTGFGPNTPMAGYRSVSADYLPAIGIPLLKGRGFNDHDDANSPRVALINAAMAQKYWPDQDPIGKRLKPLGGDGGWMQIVGLVGSVHHTSLSQPAEPEMFVPFPQNPVTQLNLVVRAVGELEPLVGAIRGIVTALDPDQSVFSLRAMNDRVNESVAQPRFNTWFLASFAGLALGLAAVGIYGVMLYTVTQRTQEIGVRMALGAQRGDVLALVVTHGLRLTLAGLALGVAGALALSRVLKSLLFGVTATDPLAFTAAALLLAVVSLIACYLPARRATRVDPILALRCD